MMTFVVQYYNYIYFLLLWTHAVSVSGGRPLRVDNETGHTYQEWEKYCLVTQYSLSSLLSDDAAAAPPSFPSPSPSPSLGLAAVSSRIFASGHAQSSGRLHSYISFSQEDLLHERSSSSFVKARQFHHSLQLPVSFRENSNSLKTTFLETFSEKDRYAEEGFEYLIYMSPSSVMLNNDLLESVFDSKDEEGGEEGGEEEDVIRCNPLPYPSLTLLLELFPYNIHSLGLNPETVHTLLSLGKGGGDAEGRLFCGVDVFVLPLRLLGRVGRRVEALISHAQLHKHHEHQEQKQPSPSLLSLSLQPRHRDYFFSAVLLNLALLEEGIRVQELSVLNTAASAPPSSDPSSSGVMIFPPPLVFEHFDDLFINSDLAHPQEEDGGFVGLRFHVPPGGLSSDCVTTIHGLAGVEGLRERWAATLNSHFFCVVAGQLLSAVAREAYLELNSHQALLRARATGEGGLLGLTGRSFVLPPSSSPSSCDHFLASPQIQGRVSFLSPLNSLACAPSFPALSSLLAAAPLPSYVHLHGCLAAATDGDAGARGVFRLARGVGGGVQCDSSSSTGEEDEEDALEALYSSLLAAPTEALPCLVAVTPALAQPRQRARFASVMMSLGLVQVQGQGQGERQEVASAAVGPHCSGRDLQAVSSLLTPSMAAALLAPVLARSPKDQDKDQGAVSGAAVALGESGEGGGGGGAPEPVFLFPGGGAGINLLRNPAGLATAVENCLPPHIFSLLLGRLKHRGYVALGANSHFVPFDGSPGRSVVERVILQYLAPLVVGHQDEARKLGFVGAEWWIQHRETGAPKEYHYDSALTWCRENGWAADELQHCPFYPQIGSIFYLTATGGPTAVLNEHTYKHNSVPPIPEQVAVIFPQKNRMGLFKGNRYHGVMHDPWKEEGAEDAADNQPRPLPEMRLTLLINYWRMRDVGENFTHILPQEGAFLRRFEDLQQTDPADSDPDSASDPDAPLFEAPPREEGVQEVAVQTDILDYLEAFQSQRLAPPLFRDIVQAAAQQAEAREKKQKQKQMQARRAPLALLSFPRNSSYSVYCRELIHEQNMTLARFTTFHRDEDSGQARVPQLGSLESHTAWRARWPHQPEDHEQQVRDMFT